MKNTNNVIPDVGQCSRQKNKVLFKFVPIGCIHWDYQDKLFIFCLRSIARI